MKYCLYGIALSMLAHMGCGIYLSANTKPADLIAVAPIVISSFEHLVLVGITIYGALLWEKGKGRMYVMFIMAILSIVPVFGALLVVAITRGYKIEPLLLWIQVIYIIMIIFGWAMYVRDALALGDIDKGGGMSK